MKEKKETTHTQKTEIEKTDIHEVEHQTVHPGQEEFSLQNVPYASGDNN